MRKTVLIVEDDALSMKLLSDVLEMHGYAVLRAVDGSPVLGMVQEHRPDLILMDIQLPRVNGLALTRALKHDGDLRRIPIVAVTAFAFMSDEQQIREAGCDGYLTKPVSLPAFLKTVRQHIG